MEIEAFIVDDERSAREVLKHHLAKFDDIRIKAETNNIDDAEKWLRENKTHILFLDISMPSGSGMELLERLGSFDFKVVFITGHSEYTIEAIRKGAFDYLLKPVLFEELEECIKRFKSTCLEEIEQEVGVSNDMLIVHDKRTTKVLDKKSVYRVESEGNYSTIFYRNGEKQVISKNLKKVHEEYFMCEPFVRVHQSHILNTSFVKEFITKESNAVLENGDVVPVSRSRKDEFKSKLK